MVVLDVRCVVSDGGFDAAVLDGANTRKNSRQKNRRSFTILFASSLFKLEQLLNIMGVDMTGVPDVASKEADNSKRHAAESFSARLMYTAGSLAGLLQGSFEFAGFLLSTIGAPKKLWVGHGMRRPSPQATAKALLQLAGTTHLLDLSMMLRELARLHGNIPLDSFELDDLSSDDDHYDDDD